MVQESLVKIWTKREKLAEIENPDAYCMTITRNMGIDKLRGRKMSTSDIDDHYSLKSSEASPERKLIAKDELSAVMKIVDALFFKFCLNLVLALCKYTFTFSKVNPVISLISL